MMFNSLNILSLIPAEALLSPWHLCCSQISLASCDRRWSSLLGGKAYNFWLCSGSDRIAKKPSDVNPRTLRETLKLWQEHLPHPGTRAFFTLHGG